MKLWLVTRTDPISYDEYDSMVVAAETEKEARHTYPAEWRVWNNHLGGWVSDWRPNELDDYGDWALPETLTVEYLGYTDREIQGVVLASFNAG